MRTTQGLTQGVLFSLLTILFLFTSQVVCQNNTAKDQGTGDVTGDGEENDGPRPIDEGMEPLYTMTKIFLDLVQPENKGHVIEVIDIKSIGKLKYVSS